MKFDAVGAWNRFWFEPDDGRALALFRLLFGFTFVLKLTGATGLFRLARLEIELPRRGVFPVSAMLDTFYAPYPGLEWMPLPSPACFARIEEALLVLALLLTAGLFTRVTTVLLAPLSTYVFFLSQLNFHHHMYFFLIVFYRDQKHLLRL